MSRGGRGALREISHILSRTLARTCNFLGRCPVRLNDSKQRHRRLWQRFVALQVQPLQPRVYAALLFPGAVRGVKGSSNKKGANADGE